MKPFDSIFLAPPPELVKPGESLKPLYQRFCTEQPNVVAFVTRHGTDFTQYQTWTALPIGWAVVAWHNYLKNGASMPVVNWETLEYHFQDNQSFVASDIAPLRNMKAFKHPLSKRKQPKLRLMMMASIFDATQSTMIAPTDIDAEPDLVADQNLAITLVGTVIDAFEDTAII